MTEELAVDVAVLERSGVSRIERCGPWQRARFQTRTREAQPRRAVTTSTPIIRGSAPLLAILFLFGGRALGASPELVMSDGQLQSVASAGATHAIPFFPSAADPLGRQGFARIVNRSDMSGTVSIDAFDDSGRNHGPITLTVDALETAPFNSGDLEDGNAAKGLAQGVGRPSDGDWRLELTSDLDIMVLSYIRTSDGFVTAMHDVAPADGNSHVIAFFNPGSNSAQVSMLRLVNAGGASASVTIHGIDDRGARAGPVRLSIPARAARTVSAAELEKGAVGLTGSLGDGAGKWRLEVEADRPIMALSMLATPTGHLTNLSTAPRLVTVPSGGDQPPAPVIEVTGAREFTFKWDWSAQAGETLAFDYAVRLGGGSWTPFCREFAWKSSSRGVIITITTDADLPAGTVIEARYRYRNSSSCDSGSPDPWSRVGQATVDGDGGTGGAPDLVVQSASVSDTAPDAGASFRLSATVRNRGDGDADATTLRYYRSSNSRISTTDTEVGTDPVRRLAAAGTSAESITLTAPSSAGTYYYGACVDAVPGESSTGNNCSDGVEVDVSGGGGGTGRAGECVEGNTYARGEGCDVYGVGSSSSERFSVLSDGRGRFGFITAGNSISNRGGSINGVRYHFVASHQGNGVWKIDEYRP